MVEAIIVSRRTSSSSEISSFWRRSAERAPITSLPILTGTQMKAMSCLLRCCREPVLSRNRGSSAILGTMIGLPVSITLPVIPSPMRYRPLACSSGRRPYASSMAISPLFLFRMVRVPREYPHMLGRELEDRLQHGLEIERLAQLVADLEEEGKLLYFPVLGVIHRCRPFRYWGLRRIHKGKPVK